MQVAVVGAGPAGFYTAGGLLASGLDIQVDLIERLPTPWGLVRQGVAPDHPNIKAVSRVFDEIAARDGFRFLGNVQVGRDVSAFELSRLYHAVVYAVGASDDRRLGIPGEDLPGSLASASFVAWYNGHPDYCSLSPDLSCTTALVVGNGNVALDVARILAIDPGELATTDIADHALRALRASAIREIVVLGRRGPAQASFTTPELRELGELNGVAAVVDPAELAIDPPDHAPARRNLETLRTWAAAPAATGSRTVRLLFCHSPAALLGDGKVEAAEIVHNRLERHPDGTVVAVPTGETEVIPCGLVLRSVGYRGVPPDGVPLDERTGTIRNRAGRVEPGVYCCGWIKRGPTGIIGTNKKDAGETVDRILEDARAGLLHAAPVAPPGAIDDLLASRGVVVVDGDGWQRIDALERERGVVEGRPRVKLCRWSDLLVAAHPEPLAAGYGVSRTDEP